jgi:hypothetical protein
MTASLDEQPARRNSPQSRRITLFDGTDIRQRLLKPTAANINDRPQHC